MTRKPNPLILAPAVAVHVAITALTWRDLSHRPTDRIRGSRALWRMASAANTAGSAAYWLVGRRRSAG